MLVFSSVSKSFDGRVALDDVSLRVATGSRTALVGVNGSGKSTLLRIAAGLVAPDSGEVAVAPGATVGHVPQDYGLLAAMPVEEYVQRRTGVFALRRRLRALERRLSEDADVLEAYGDALDRFAAVGGYELDGRVDRALETLRLPRDVLTRPLGALSGGQQVRVGLAAVLASQHSLYLLDEPTTALDLLGLDLLERFVLDSGATFLIVSHDRAFLDAVATDVVELDEHRHDAQAYGVSFAEFRALRERALAARLRRHGEYRAEVERLSAEVARQRQTAARDTDRRPRRDNDKFAPHFFAQRSARQAGRAARGLEQRLAKMEAVEEPRTGWELRLSLDAARRGGDRVLTVHDVTATLGDFRLGPVSLTLARGDRLALQGSNGAGKSVLLDILAGRRMPDGGAVQVGEGVQRGLFAQAAEHVDSDTSGLEAFNRQLGQSRWPASEARTLLAKFDLGAEHVLRPVSGYSPGERCRLALAVLMAQGANLLLLDEPTTHLDLEATEQLEQALARFAGTVLVISHDREFLARIGVTRRLELRDGRVEFDALV